MVRYHEIQDVLTCAERTEGRLETTPSPYHPAFRLRNVDTSCILESGNRCPSARWPFPVGSPAGWRRGLPRKRCAWYFSRQFPDLFRISRRVMLYCPRNHNDTHSQNLRKERGEAEYGAFMMCGGTDYLPQRAERLLHPQVQGQMLSGPCDGGRADAGNPRRERPVPDFARLEPMVERFRAAGFTYFDTAWMYHDFMSEPSLGRVVVSR